MDEFQNQAARSLHTVIANKLVGKKITGVVLSSDGESAGFSLNDGSVVWVDRDPEGNGPGWLSVTK
jgi:hypothetical protein